MPNGGLNSSISRMHEFVVSNDEQARQPVVLLQ